MLAVVEGIAEAVLLVPGPVVAGLIALKNDKVLTSGNSYSSRHHYPAKVQALLWARRDRIGNEQGPLALPVGEAANLVVALTKGKRGKEQQSSKLQHLDGLRLFCLCQLNVSGFLY